MQWTDGDHCVLCIISFALCVLTAQEIRACFRSITTFKSSCREHIFDIKTSRLSRKKSEPWPTYSLSSPVINLYLICVTHPAFLFNNKTHTEHCITKPPCGKISGQETYHDTHHRGGRCSARTSGACRVIGQSSPLASFASLAVDERKFSTF